jgi:hypothetical protein
MCNKRLPRETQNSFEGNKNHAKTHISRMRIILISPVPTSVAGFLAGARGAKTNFLFHPAEKENNPVPLLKRRLKRKKTVAEVGIGLMESGLPCDRV